MRLRYLWGASCLVIAACGDDDGVTNTADAGANTLQDAGDASSSASDATTASDASFVSSCSGSGNSKIVCAANELLTTLPSASKSLVNLAYSDFASRTQWSNLPGVTRAGVKMGSLDTNSKAAALSLMRVVLSADGDEVLTGIMNADDYLGSYSGSSGGGMGGPPGGGGGSTYSASNYAIAIFGTPSTSGDWALSFGGHHMAFNLTWKSGVGYATPNHLGVEPKAAFTINGQSYEPLGPAGEAFFALFDSLDASTLASAYLSGTFSDVVIGPVEYGAGSTTLSKAKFPTGSARTGVKVSALTTDQQALVVAAIKAWVSNYDTSIADSLVSAYTSADAFSDTLIAWGGTQSVGPDPDTNGTYLRIDGPRLWLELACQGGVVIQNISHFHTIYRDKQFDYGADF